MSLTKSAGKARRHPPGHGQARHPAARHGRGRHHVHRRRRGHPPAASAKPIGSLTQMGTIRLGKRTDDRTPAHQGVRAARQARRHRVRRLGHLPRRRLPGGRQGRRARRRSTSTQLQGLPVDHQADAGGVRAGVRQEAAPRPTSRPGKTKMDLAEQLIDDIKQLQEEERLRPAGRWCGAARPRSTAARPPCHATLAAFEKGLRGRATRTSRRRRSTPTRALKLGRPLRQRRAEPDRRHRRRCSSWPSRTTCRSAARTSRPARR